MSSCLFQAAILRRPDFLLFQAAMEPFDVAVAFRVMIRRPPMDDAEPCESVSKKREEVNCVPLSVVSVKFASRLPAGKPAHHGLLHRCERFLGSAAMRKIPAHDLPRAAVDHTHQIRPAHVAPAQILVMSDCQI